MDIPVSLLKLMKHLSKILSTLLLTGIMGSAVATAKPLKVYILAGQSNMVGHAKTDTLPYMLQDPAIHDVRKDLDVPKMPFVIGVLGVNGSYLDNTQEDPRHVEFQKAMAAVTRHGLIRHLFGTGPMVPPSMN